MPQQTFDPGSKWLVEEQGAGILYLAGERAVHSCRAKKAEVVHPRKLPDGLLEVRYAAGDEPNLVLVEVATRPEKRVVDQVADDIRLVRQARGVLPEALVLVLRPHGKYRVPDHVETVSRRGWTQETLRWKVIELWTLSAEELLAAPDVGVIPWVPLARYDGRPEVLLRRCRERIEKDGGKKSANLLAVAQVFARVKFDRPDWLAILGGTPMFYESPLVQEIVLESRVQGRVKSIVEVLQARFDAVPPNISAGLQEIKDEAKLERLTRQAALTGSLAAFEESLREELPAPPPPSTRGKRRPRKAAE